MIRGEKENWGTNEWEKGKTSEKPNTKKTHNVIFANQSRPISSSGGRERNSVSGKIG